MSLRLGFSQVEITPPLGTRMAGFFNDRRAEGIHDPLYARAMAIDNGEHPVIFVTCDLLSLKRTTVLAAKERIAAQTKVPAESVMVSATHTHTGPATSRIFQMDPDREYVDRLPEWISEAAIRAWESRVPGTLGIGWGFEGKLSFNRRFMMRSTRQVLMHPPKGSTDILYQEGRVDPEVGVLSAKTAAGEPLGCLLNFACHVNVLGGAEVSADYPGYFAAAMQSKYGESYTALFANGCCGNLCQIDVYDPERDDRGHQWARYMGERLAKDVQQIQERLEYSDEWHLDSRFVEVQMPRRRLTKELMAWAAATRELGDAAEFHDAIYARLAFEMQEEWRTEPTFPAPIQAFRLGDVGIVTYPGEIFVEHGLDTKLNSPAARTFVVELANGIVGYVPTREAFVGGGYEQRPATSSQLAPVAGETMVQTGLSLLDSMFC